jgi:nitrate reductase gamma subunit
VTEDADVARRFDPDRDADPADGRNETFNERMDRNWNEILQELRVTQTGTQILTGFLLTIVFQPKFSELDHFQHAVYLVLVVLAGLTTVLGLTPVLLHRELFRRQMKGTVVRTADIFLRAALAGIALVLMGTELLVFDVAVDREAGLIAAGVTLCVLSAIAVLPLAIRAHRVKRV